MQKRFQNLFWPVDIGFWQNIFLYGLSNRNRVTEKREGAGVHNRHASKGSRTPIDCFEP